MSDTRGCACVCDDADECFRRRYHIQWDEYYEHTASYERERCECACHYPDEDDAGEWWED